jgi:hypothetical protein
MVFQSLNPLQKINITIGRLGEIDIGLVFGIKPFRSLDRIW